MADWRKAITNDILSKPDVPPYKPEKGREQLAKIVEKIGTQIANNSIKAPNRLWKTRHDKAIVVALKIKDVSVPIKDADGNERTEFAIPEGQAAAVLEGLAKAIRTTDEFDDAIKAALEASPESNAAGTAKTSKPKAAAAGDGKPSKGVTQLIGAAVRRGWDENRLVDELYKKDVEEADIDGHLETFRKKMAAKA